MESSSSSSSSFETLLKDPGVQVYLLVLGCAIATCLVTTTRTILVASTATEKHAWSSLDCSSSNNNNKRQGQSSQPLLSSVVLLLVLVASSLMLISITWFYIFRFILQHQHTSESYFDDAYKDVLQTPDLYFTSSQLLTWAIVAVVWMATNDDDDEKKSLAAVPFLIYGFLGAMSASFVLWIPTITTLAMRQQAIHHHHEPKRISIIYVLTSLASFVCILNLVPCSTETTTTTEPTTIKFQGSECTPNQGFGSFAPNFHDALHGLHSVLLLPILVTLMVGSTAAARKQAWTVDATLLYGAMAVTFAGWHLWQMVGYGRTFHVPQTDCQASITIDLLACTALTLYTVYFQNNNNRNDDNSIVTTVVVAFLGVPLVSPAVVLAGHLCARHARASHAAWITHVQRQMAQQRQQDDHQSPSPWCNLGLWRETVSASPHKDYDQACQQLALALGHAAGLDKTDAVLSCGCGADAAELSFYKERFHLRHITGMDPQISLQSSDTSNTLRRDEHYNIRRIRASAQEMKLHVRPGSFTKIFALDNVYHYPDKYQFFVDSAHLLPLGGKVAVTDILLRNEDNETAPLWVRAALKLMGAHNVWTEGQYRHQLAKAGFEQIDIQLIGKDVFCGWKHLFPESLLRHIEYATIVGTVAKNTNESPPPKKVAIIGSGM